MKQEFFQYKEKSLVRKDNVLYYGNIEEDFVAMITIESCYDLKDIKIGDRVILRLISTDPNIKPQDVVVKHTVKNNLYDALDVAGIWIDRYKKRTLV